MSTLNSRFTPSLEEIPQTVGQSPERHIGAQKKQSSMDYIHKGRPGREFESRVAGRVPGNFSWVIFKRRERERAAFPLCLAAISFLLSLGKGVKLHNGRVFLSFGASVEEGGMAGREHLRSPNDSNFACFVSNSPRPRWWRDSCLEK